MAELAKIFVFDFDGVVCDSTNECMVTSWNAWEKWNDREGFRLSLENFSSEEIRQFRDLRPRVRGAGEYYILRRSLEEGRLIEGQSTYDEFEKKWFEYLQPFKEVFFGMRNRFRKENLDGWIGLHQTFDDVIKVMKPLYDANRLYVATLKDEESVRLILEKQGLNLPSDHLLDQSQIKSKLQALNRFLKQTGFGKDDLVFIDDNVTHLLEPKSEGFKVYLAAWNSPVKEYLDLAAQHKIQILKDCNLLISGRVPLN
jgi:phosphoglycolate phosphatase-like HAD superfamily hydrolase